MEHTFCLNSGSLRAQGADEAISLLKTALSGLFLLPAATRAGTKIIYDSLNLGSFLSIELSPGFSFRDVIDRLQGDSERDLAEVILELFDKGPALSFLDDEELEELASTSFFYPDVPYTTSDDCLAIAWHFDATLLSLNTAPQWSEGEVEIGYMDSENRVQRHTLPHVSCQEHVALHLTHVPVIGEASLRACLDGCLFSEAFLAWFNSLDEKNLMRVSKKLLHAKDIGFDGKEPLFKSLGGDEGLWEIRFSFFPGGAARIIYKPQPGRKYALLSGWVKKSDREGYAQQIRVASQQLAAGRLT